MFLIFDIDRSPFVPSGLDLTTSDVDGGLRSHDCKGNDVCNCIVQCPLFVLKLFRVVGIHPQTMDLEFLSDPLLESRSFFERQGIRLGDDGNNIDHVVQLSQNLYIKGLQLMTCWRYEKETAVDSGIFDEPWSLCRQFSTQVCRVLIFDVFDYRVPAPVVVDLITVPGSIDNVEPEVDTVLLYQMADSFDLGRAAHRLIWIESALAIYQMGGEEGVDESALP